MQDAIATLRPGDTLAVASLARLARSLATLTAIVEQLDDRKARRLVAGELFVAPPSGGRCSYSLSSRLSSSRRPSWTQSGLKPTAPIAVNRTLE